MVLTPGFRRDLGLRVDISVELPFGALEARTSAGLTTLVVG